MPQPRKPTATPKLWQEPNCQTHQNRAYLTHFRKLINFFYPMENFFATVIVLLLVNIHSLKPMIYEWQE
jgi:hypothetical protein